MKTSKSAVFLFELMIIILIFTVAAAVCTRIFSNSYAMSVDSRALTMSSIHAQSVAEHFKASDGADTETQHFDRDWVQIPDEANARYSILLEDNGSVDAMIDAYVNVYEKGKTTPIYTLHVKEFLS
jgi:Tfp pilus assembly protein PilE